MTDGAEMTLSPSCVTQAVASAAHLPLVHRLRAQIVDEPVNQRSRIRRHVANNPPVRQIVTSGHPELEEVLGVVLHAKLFWILAPARALRHRKAAVPARDSSTALPAAAPPGMTDGGPRAAAGEDSDAGRATRCGSQTPAGPRHATEATARPRMR